MELSSLYRDPEINSVSPLSAVLSITQLLSVCVSSIYPLTFTELLLSLQAGCIDQLSRINLITPHLLQYLLRRLVISGILLERSDGTFVVFHRTFVDWLVASNFIPDLRSVYLPGLASLYGTRHY